MSDKLKRAIALLDEIHDYIDEWNFPIDLQDRITEFLNEDHFSDAEKIIGPSAIELQHAEIGIPELVTDLLNPVA